MQATNYESDLVFNLYTNNVRLSLISFFVVASDGDHLISLIDGISYKSPSAPMISQINDIPPEQFCHGDNLPPNCTSDCTCTHKIDIPLNAIVEVVLVDEGLYSQDECYKVFCRLT